MTTIPSTAVNGQVTSFTVSNCYPASGLSLLSQPFGLLCGDVPAPRSFQYFCESESFDISQITGCYRMHMFITKNYRRSLISFGADPLFTLLLLCSSIFGGIIFKRLYSCIHLQYLQFEKLKNFCHKLHAPIMV